jgi:hypothetical protein
LGALPAAIETFAQRQRTRTVSPGCQAGKVLTARTTRLFSGENIALNRQCEGGIIQRVLTGLKRSQPLAA